MRYANTHYHVDPIIDGKGFPLHSTTPAFKTRKAAYAALLAMDNRDGYGVSTCRTTIAYCRERAEVAERFAMAR